MLSHSVTAPLPRFKSQHLHSLPYLEMGYFRIKAGENILGIEEEIVWATPGQFTITNYPCNEDGSDCSRTGIAQMYTDPSSNLEQIQRRLASHRSFR